MELPEQLNGKTSIPSYIDPSLSNLEIVRFIIYDTGISDVDGKMVPALINQDEFRYIFQIAYHFLQRISDLDLIMNP